MFKILIAEDDIMSQTLLKRVLTSWGYDVIVCNDGDEAWKAFQSDDAPQLAILDWMMPGLDYITSTFFLMIPMLSTVR
ncbi:MAG: response regulator [Proteobacteria bacterium]|nr:response regulator [Pseudomonadota bacterium]